MTTNGGAETHLSSPFSIEVPSCSSSISFPNLASSYTAFVGSTPPTIDTSTASNNSECVVDKGSYVLNNSVSGISIASNGKMSIILTKAFTSTSMTASVTSNGGAETHTSAAFSIL